MRRMSGYGTRTPAAKAQSAQPGGKQPSEATVRRLMNRVFDAFAVRLASRIAAAQTRNANTDLPAATFSQIEQLLQGLWGAINFGVNGHYSCLAEAWLCRFKQKMPLAISGRWNSA